MTDWCFCGSWISGAPDTWTGYWLGSHLRDKGKDSSTWLRQEGIAKVSVAFETSFPVLYHCLALHQCMPNQSTAGCLQAADWLLQALGPPPQDKDSALTYRLPNTYFCCAQFLHKRHQTWHKLVFGRRSYGAGWSSWSGLCHCNPPDHLAWQTEHINITTSMLPPHPIF